MNDSATATRDARWWKEECTRCTEVAAISHGHDAAHFLGVLKAKRAQAVGDGFPDAAQRLQGIADKLLAREA